MGLYCPLRNPVNFWLKAWFRKAHGPWIIGGLSVKNFIRIFLLGVTVSMFGAVPAFGAIIMIVDENGNGTFNGAPIVGFTASDPGPGGHPTLTYPASFVVLPGDVFLSHPDGTDSDLI